MGRVMALNYFILEAYQNGNKQDKEFAKFIVKNYLKGMLISTTLVTISYLSRFKTYRNSHLLKAQILASVFGVQSAAYGIIPIFSAYMFNKQMPASILTDVNTQDFGNKSNDNVNELLAKMYLKDLQFMQSKTNSSSNLQN
eukprot:403366364